MKTVNKPRQHYPVFIDFKKHAVMIVGGEHTAVGKLKRLIRTDAEIWVVSEHLSPAMLRICEQHGIEPQRRDFVATDLINVTLVIAASESTTINALVAKEAHRANVLVNVANKPNDSSFLVPSMVDRYPLQIAISSSGTSPALARALTNRIEAFVPLNYGALGELYKRYRQHIQQALPHQQERRKFWSRVLNGRVAELILQGQTKKAEAAIDELLENNQRADETGEVYLVGAGPGDPDLLSFRALRLMQQCDVVLYDRLVSDEILALVNRHAEQIYVGKQRNHHTASQESINNQLARLAKQGKRVLRLKGGDPFIFGRGGEEIETLADQGVDFQVVPGITAASGCASYAGIPLTHRDHAQVCLFVTGHLRDGSVNLDWPVLARPQQTVVIYMGLVGLDYICQQLQSHGLAGDHPVAIIAKGTRRNQQVITGTLKDLASKVVDSDIRPPTLIIVGHVVTLRNKLAWFEPE
ncbi:MAG: siroheme synthase CysG [Granulosicoccus sp.]|nr:siroheme synthase CysG [Granulosicoccus sp.]